MFDRLSAAVLRSPIPLQRQPLACLLLSTVLCLLCPCCRPDEDTNEPLKIACYDCTYDSLQDDGSDSTAKVCAPPMQIDKVHTCRTDGTDNTCHTIVNFTKRGKCMYG